MQPLVECTRKRRFPHPGRLPAVSVPFPCITELAGHTHRPPLCPKEMSPGVKGRLAFRTPWPTSPAGKQRGRSPEGHSVTQPRNLPTGRPQAAVGSRLMGHRAPRPGSRSRKPASPPSRLPSTGHLTPTPILNPLPPAESVAFPETPRFFPAVNPRPRGRPDSSFLPLLLCVTPGIDPS